MDAALVVATAPLPATAWLRSIPGLGPTLTAIVLAELGDIAWFTTFSQLRKLAGLDIIRVQSGQWRGRRASRAVGAPSCAGRCTRRPSGPVGPRPGARSGPPC